jgi:hypothetical protein
VSDAAVATAPADGGATCRDYDACVSAAEFDGSEKFASQSVHRDPENFREFGSRENGGGTGKPYFQYSLMTHQMTSAGTKRVNRNWSNGKNDSLAKGKTCPFSTNWSISADPTAPQHMMM